MARSPPCRRSDLERFQDALGDFDRGFELAGESAGPYLSRARVLMRLGRPDEAFRDLDRFIEHNPDDSNGYRQRAAALFESGRLEEARIDIDRAIEKAPGQYGNYVDRALYLLHGAVDCGRALEDLRAAREVTPETWLELSAFTSRVQLVGVYYACPEQFDPNEALRLAHRATELSPDEPTIQAILGLALYRAGRFPEARRKLTQALDREVHPEPGPC